MARDRRAEIERIIHVREVIMEKDGLTKTGFAKKLGFDLKRYNQIEKRGANVNYLVALFEAYGISLDYIVEGIKPPDL